MLFWFLNVLLSYSICSQTVKLICTIAEAAFRMRFHVLPEPKLISKPWKHLVHSHLVLCSTRLTPTCSSCDAACDYFINGKGQTSLCCSCNTTHTALQRSSSNTHLGLERCTRTQRSLIHNLPKVLNNCYLPNRYGAFPQFHLFLCDQQNDSFTCRMVNVYK